MDDYNVHTMEAAAIAKARKYLQSPEVVKTGATAAQIAKEIGVGIGYLTQILRSSQQGWRREGFRWFVDDSGLADWREHQQRPDYWMNGKAPAPKFYRDLDGSLRRVGYDGSVFTVLNVFKR